MLSTIYFLFFAKTSPEGSMESLQWASKIFPALYSLAHLIGFTGHNMIATFIFIVNCQHWVCSVGPCQVLRENDIQWKQWACEFPLLKLKKVEESICHKTEDFKSWSECILGDCQ